jgi:hypothetical protein
MRRRKTNPIDDLEAFQLILALWLAAAVLIVAMSQPAHSHDVWADGSPVPAWVKTTCCGPQDVHMDPPAHHEEDGWHIDGIETVIPDSQVLPSQDGHFWAFYVDGVKSPQVYCFFAPMAF